ncbi:MAG: PilW family protein, partial [Gemmatimonadales bacterium]
MTAPTRDQAGFSLLELMVAMVVTLIVTGAIYGLLAGGQSAFRREPQLTERQQNTRLAMSLLEQDIGAAGVGLPAFAQVFTPGLDGGALPDAIEIVVGLPACPATVLCVRNADAGNTMVVETRIGVPDCAGVTALGGPALGALRISGANPNRAIIGVVTNLGNPGNACAAAGSAGNAFGVTLSLDWAAGPATWRHLAVPGPVPAPFAGPPAAVTGFFVPVQVVRYIVATDPNDVSNPGDPNFLHLWRSMTGGRSAGDNWLNPQPAPGPEWQL